MKITFVILLFLMFCFTADGHPGRTDSRGGHYDRKNGTYHYHNGGGTSSKANYSSHKSIDNELKHSQEKLNELGFECGVPDGIMGDKTKQAIIDFQKSKGLITDGVLGAITKKELVGGGKVLFRKGSLSHKLIDNELKQIQEKLIELGFNCCVPDGIMGDKTRHAIIDFQKSKGLITDGILGTITKKELGILSE